MSVEPTAAVVKEKPKRKKLVIILAVVVVLLVLAAGAAFMVLKNRAQADTEGDEEAPAAHAAPEVAPTFLPLETMVVNLADPGGERFAQIGITLEVSDPKVAEKIKVYLPAIRSAVLLLISQRTAAELLQREGKDTLAEDIRREVGRPLGFVPPAAVASGAGSAARGAKATPASNPVKKVLFASFIVQ